MYLLQIQCTMRKTKHRCERLELSSSEKSGNGGRACAVLRSVLCVSEWLFVAIRIATVFDFPPPARRYYYDDLPVIPRGNSPRLWTSQPEPTVQKIHSVLRRRSGTTTAIVAHTRSEYPNQINVQTVLPFDLRKLDAEWRLWGVGFVVDERRFGILSFALDVHLMQSRLNNFWHFFLFARNRLLFRWRGSGRLQ
jgi:hypothetical protein